MKIIRSTESDGEVWDITFKTVLGEMSIVEFPDHLHIRHGGISARCIPGDVVVLEEASVAVEKP